MLFVSCENFLTGSLIKEQLQDEIDYANAPEFTVRFSPKKPEMGNVITGNEKKVKVSDKLKISFECSSNYIFDKWVVLDKKNEKKLNGYVEIADPYNQETEIEILKESDSILIRPLCNPCMIYESYSPNITQNGVSRDRAIIVTFNENVATDTFYFSDQDFKDLGYLTEEDGNWVWSDSIERFYEYIETEWGYSYQSENCYGYRLYNDDSYIYFKNVKITCDGENMLKYFDSPEIQNGKQVIIKTKAVIPMNGNATRTMHVELSKNLQNTSGVSLKEDISWQYRFDASLDQNVQVTLEGSIYNWTDSESFQFTGAGAYKVGDTFNISAAENVIDWDERENKFKRWIYDESELVLEDPYSNNTKATLINGAGQVKLTAYYTYMRLYGVPDVVNVTIRNGIEADAPEINYGNSSSWQTDEDADKNFIRNNKLNISVTVNGSRRYNIQNIVIEESLSTYRNGANANNIFVTKKVYPYSELKKTGDLENGEIVTLNTIYELQGPEVPDGLYNIKITVNNEFTNRTLDYYVIKINKLLDEDFFIMTNEPEIWRQGEINRNEDFNEDWYNEEIKKLRWGIKLIGNFKLLNKYYYNEITVDEQSCSFNQDDGTSDCFKLTNYCTLDSSAFKKDSDTCIKVYTRIHNIGEWKDFYRYIPPAVQIKAVTDKKYFLPDYDSISNYDKENYVAKGPYYSPVLENVYCTKAKTKANTMVFAMDKKTEVTNASEYFPEYYNTNTNVGGIYNAAFNMADKYGYIYESVFKLPKATLKAFNYSGTRYGTSDYRKKLYGYNAASTNTSSGYGSRLLSPTATYFYNFNATESDTTVLSDDAANNEQELTVASFNYASSGIPNSKSVKIQIKLNDSHPAADGYEVYKYVAIYPIPNNDTNLYKECFNVAEYNVNSKCYEAILSSDVNLNNLILKPWRVVVSKESKKSHSFAGTEYRINGVSNDSGSYVYQTTLFADENRTIDTEYNREKVEFGVSSHGEDACAVKALNTNNHSKKYTAKSYIVKPNESNTNGGYVQNESYFEKLYNEGLFTDAYVSNAGENINPEEPVYFGLPLTDLPDGDYLYSFYIEDEYNNHVFTNGKDFSKIRLYSTKDNKVKTYDPNGDLNFNFFAGYVVIYEYKDNNWKIRLAKTERADGSYYHSHFNANSMKTTFEKLREENSEKGCWIKYYTYYNSSERNFNVGPMYFYNEGPSYWQYAYVAPEGKSPEVDPNKSLVTAGGGAIINSNVPVLVYTVASSRNRDETGENWELRPKYIDFKTLDLKPEHPVGVYSYKTKEIPKGWYYKIVAHFADGEILETEVMQK